MKAAPSVVEKLRLLGLTDRLAEMVSKAAIVSHPKGNRRYHFWVFDVEGDCVLHMTDMRNTPVPSEQVTCEGCKGSGCSTCAGTGNIRVVTKVV